MKIFLSIAIALFAIVMISGCGSSGSAEQTHYYAGGTLPGSCPCNNK